MNYEQLVIVSDRKDLTWEQQVEYKKVREWARDVKLSRQKASNQSTDLSAQDILNEVGA